MTFRKLVYDTLEFNNKTGRVPRQMWTLPWAQNHHSRMLAKIYTDFPEDLAVPHTVYKEYPKTSGDQYKIGTFVDEWGCVFTNVADGVIGEVKNPLVVEDDWSDYEKVHIPYELLSFDTDQVNEACKNQKFNYTPIFPRPFEQLQFIRGTQNLYMDLLDPPSNMLKFISKMHTFYCELLEKWAKTNVDALFFMDDWGSQRSLLINPSLWREYFKPLYKDYISIAHSHNKKAMMHSDGYIIDILPDLIEIGLDAINSQIFCMGIDKLKQFAQKITFWGELDRQLLLPYGSLSDIDNAVKEVYQNLWKDGGCIAQLEFGPGANPDNVYRAYQTWNNIRQI